MVLHLCTNRHHSEDTARLVKEHMKLVLGVGRGNRKETASKGMRGGLDRNTWYVFMDFLNNKILKCFPLEILNLQLNMLQICGSKFSVNDSF